MTLRVEVLSVGTQAELRLAGRDLMALELAGCRDSAGIATVVPFPNDAAGSSDSRAPAL